MSKFIDEAFATSTDIVKAVQRPMRLSIHVGEEVDLIRLRRQYHIKAEYLEYGWLTDIANKEEHAAMKNEMLRLFKRRLYHQVFGGFTLKLMLLEQAIHDEDYAAAKNALADLWEETRP